MARVQILIILILMFVSPASSDAYSVTREYSESEFEYDVRFTNPECRTYRYQRGIENRAGDKILREKPRNVYCSSRDRRASENRRESPTTKLLNWIEDPNTEEIFMAFLSFSNGTVADALCKAVKERGVKIRVVLDEGAASVLVDEDTGRPILDRSGRRQYPKLERMLQVKRCAEEAGNENLVEYVLRGRSGGIRYAHNKIIFINPSDRRAPAKIAYGSANMSSGLVLHHENWNFVTIPKRSFFAQRHLCVLDGMWNDSTSGSTKSFARHIKGCTQKISGSEEEEIKTFFVPGEGEAAQNLVIDKIRNAKRVSVAAHRFSNGKIIDALKAKLRKDRRSVRLITDDDTFWAGKSGRQVGGLGPSDYRRVESLEREGLQVRFMETNHHSGRLLHHNKFMVFEFDNGTYEVYTGAGNWTSAAYRINYENFYHVTLASVAKKFADQYEYMWNELATKEGDLPKRDMGAR